MWWTVALTWLKKLAWPIAALLGLLSVLAGKRHRDRRMSRADRDEYDRAILAEIAERKRRMEVEADGKLDKERSLDLDSQRDAVLERVRKRRAAERGDS